MVEYNNLLHMGYDYEKPDEYIDPMKPIIEEIMGEFRIQQEDNVMKAVADVGIYVDKPRLMQALTDAKAFYEEGYRAAMQRADVVEVVRCKDCKYWNEKGFDPILDVKFGICNCEHLENDYFYIETDETDFCSYGAKMDGKGEGE